MRAEFTLFAAAITLSLVALLVAPRRITQAWRVPTALLVATLGAISPLVLYQLTDPALAAGRALWEWSAAGGPTIQASYRLDGLGAIAVSAGFAYVAAALLANALTAARTAIATAAATRSTVTTTAMNAKPIARASEGRRRGELADRAFARSAAAT